jgi:hypothetical protein
LVETPVIDTDRYGELETHRKPALPHPVSSAALD